MTNRLSMDEIENLEQYLSKAYEPITPRMEFVNHLRQRILDPAPQVLLAHNRSFEFWLVFWLSSLFAALGFLWWRFYCAKKLSL